jgi:hypothetical protein
VSSRLYTISIDEFSRVGDRAKDLDGNVSNLLTSVHVVVRLEIGGDGLDILNDGGEMLNNVSGDLGDINVRGPGGNLGKVTLDTLAALEISWDLLDENDNFLDGINDVGNIECLEVLYDSIDFSLKGISIGEASFEFVAGVVEGFVNKNDLNEIKACLTDADTLETEIDDIVKDLETLNVANIIDAVKKIVVLVQ